MSLDDKSVYSQITDSQERMMITDIYIVGTVGLTVSISIIYSLINVYQKLKDKNSDYYYKTALKCGMALCIGNIFVYLLQLLFNDLVLPIDQFIINNVDFVSIIDSVIMILNLTAKLSFYYGFTFMYLFIFKKDKIDICFKIIMVFAGIATFIWGLLYLVDDLLVMSLKEISITEKRGIYISSLLNAPNSSSVIFLALIALIIDLIYVGLLFYRFISGARQINNYYDAVKGIVLLSISSFVWCVTVMTVGLGLDVKYLLNNIFLVIDSICLYLMYNNNYEIYNNLCGCLCGKCCGSLCFGSKYQPISTNDDDEQENDQRLVV